jgi:DNA-binding YbaB/EbfC family protein
MMKDIGNLQKMLKTAKEMQEKLQKELAELRVEGTSGGGMVSIVMDGKKTLISVRLDPEVVNKDDIGMLQDLITAAFNDATAKVDEHLSQKLGSLGGGLKIPGLF